ncbi:asparaginase [Corynebacterium renale]|uniref:asparaginase n=1 Tax=Corynebacterium renale TaxID=1724 RepID=A0A2A9DQH4_9CORY|nr:asparaginase [Corynebacterium renale]PFG28415.1 L-asparaginase [Corynebacterium renale]SQI26470.1 L-asparaginase [Corynebacterium renale]
MGTPHTSDHTPSAHIAVITTGGTIACTRDAQGALIPTVSGEDVVREVASHFDAEHVRFTVNDVAHLDSSSLTVEDIDRILQAIATALADPTVTGVVVTHGTDSMEETALASDLFHHDPRPVIFTGAMRPADDPSADGPRNLANAAMVAMDPSAREMGSLIVMGTHVLPARGTTKTHTIAEPGFTYDGPAEPTRPQALPLAPLGGRGDVDIIYCWPGAPGTLIEAAVQRGAAGIVLVGMGAGNIGTACGAAAEAAVEAGIPVVMTSRAASGPVVAEYGGAGGGAELAARGVIPGGILSAGQARIALLAALATGSDPRTLF